MGFPSQTNNFDSVVVMTKAYPNVERNGLILLQEIANYMFLACGAVYIILGIFCLGVLKYSRQQKATSREQAVKDLEGIWTRKDGVQQLICKIMSRLLHGIQAKGCQATIRKIMSRPSLQRLICKIMSRPSLQRLGDKPYFKKENMSGYYWAKQSKC